jgi:hypothetical protein
LIGVIFASLARSPPMSFRAARCPIITAIAIWRPKWLRP